MGMTAADRGGKHPERTGGGREPSLVTLTTGHKGPNWPGPPWRWQSLVGALRFLLKCAGEETVAHSFSMSSREQAEQSFHESAGRRRQVGEVN
ncbi:hypothetical protein D4764_04G0004210 [Takifugu flavidus]|uniref:Uncharacterized protein n=1 Tax=Takifugu flavidus TaxID=433684 RepID=A0A5C6N2W4_9TELE|nr:hypothetical protein D4764_04G0004210 [Takifugu flavidus]